MVQLTGNEYYVLVLALSWTLGFLPLFLGKRWTWIQCIGLAMVLHPFIRMGVTFLRTYELLFVPTVLEPASPIALWRSIDGQLWYNLVLPLLGLFLIHSPFSDTSGASGLRRERFSDALLERGIGPRAGIRRDVMRGLSLFLILGVAYLAAYALSQVLAPIVQPGDDESLYWRNITIPLIVLLSLSAGLSEEFLFRGLLLRALAKRMPFLAAALLQAVLFGLIHAGYGSPLHVLGPAVFGLGMAWVARHLGVVVTALLHAEINIIFFTVDVAPTYVAVNGVLGLAALLSVSGLLVAACVWSLVETRADAVRILWRDLLSGFGLRKRAPAAAAGSEREGDGRPE